jgi:hypothetical protein
MDEALQVAFRTAVTKFVNAYIDDAETEDVPNSMPELLADFGLYMETIALDPELMKEM